MEERCALQPVSPKIPPQVILINVQTQRIVNQVSVLKMWVTLKCVALSVYNTLTVRPNTSVSLESVSLMTQVRCVVQTLQSLVPRTYVSLKSQARSVTAREHVAPPMSVPLDLGVQRSTVNVYVLRSSETVTAPMTV